MTTVLLVDDDAAYRRSLRAFLDASYDIRVVGDTGDGAAAVGLARELRPDAVVVDLAMPGVGGVDTAAEITAALPGTVIVVVTGTHEAEDPHPGRECGRRGVASEGRSTAGRERDPVARAQARRRRS